MKISTSMHPEYVRNILIWEKFRYTYEGGEAYIDKYLRRFSSRETVPEFNDRKAISYCPAFAKAAINDVKNSIFQRMVEVSRRGGSNTYTTAMVGLEGGVDQAGSSMSSYIGQLILPELLSMGKVGIYVDNPSIPDGATLLDAQGQRPYLYVYRAEDIRNWSHDRNGRLSAVILRDTFYDMDADLLLPDQKNTKYRLLRKTPAGVTAEFYDSADKQIGETVTLEITEIPLTILRLTNSLLSDVADFQKALLNLASADMNYTLRANFPFLTEQYDPRTLNPYLKKVDGADLEIISTDSVADAQVEAAEELGVSHGRRYAKDMERPGFINPSPDPLRVSMEKQAVLKREIREIINLNLANLEPTMASAESKKEDATGLEAGLSYIGLVLENGENRVAEFWDMYEKANKHAEVSYPKSYRLKTDAERRDEAKQMLETMPSVPSMLFRKTVSKAIATTLVGDKVSRADMAKIISEIENADVVITDPEIIHQDIEDGLLSPETGSKARGYPEGEYEKAQAAHAKRLALIQASQTPVSVSGNPDTTVDPNGGAIEKEAVKGGRETDPENKPTTRGKGK